MSDLERRLRALEERMESAEGELINIGKKVDGVTDYVRSFKESHERILRSVLSALNSEEGPET